MDNFNYREFKKSDLNQISELIRSRKELSKEDSEKRIELFKWLALKNPNSVNMPTYFVVEKNRKLLGYLGRMPVKFSFDGRIEGGFFVHDLYVQPDYRKIHGLFLSMGLYDVAENKSNSFVCGLWATPLNTNMIRRRGYKELKGEKYVKILNPVKLLDPRRKIKIPFKTIIIRILYPVIKIIITFIDLIILNFPGSKIKIHEINRFDDRFDKFYKKNLKVFRYSTFRNKAYMNWKFIDRPYSQNKVFVGEKNGEISGYIVLGANPKGKFLKATILDLIADPEDPQTITALCRKAVKHFKKMHVFSINCLLTDKRYSKIFKRHLFLKDPATEPIFFANLEKININNNDILNINKWHFTYGDSDGSMLRA